MMARLLVLLLLTLPAWGVAAPFEIQPAHCDFTDGPLTLNPESADPLPDGCFGQILAAGEEIPLFLHSPGSAIPDAHFSINGREAGINPGYWLSERVFIGDTDGIRTIYLRIWNSKSPATATGYWQSPLYNILPGIQQVSFPRLAWVFHPQTLKSPAEKQVSEDQSAVDRLAEERVEICPNPFNSTTLLNLELPHAGPVRIAVYDISGRQAAMLEDGIIASGRHSYTLDGSQLATGTYFLQVRTESRTQVHKLLLLK